MIGMIVSANISSRTALKTASETNQVAVRSANQTARVSLHVTYVTPRIKAVTDFLEAVQNGRGNPTRKNLGKALTAFLTLRILAFEETDEAKDVTARANALTENLRAMVDNRHHVPTAPAETMLKELDSATRAAEADEQDYREAGADMTSYRLRDGVRQTADLRAALDLLRELQRSGGAAPKPRKPSCMLSALASECGTCIWPSSPPRSVPTVRRAAPSTSRGASVFRGTVRTLQRPWHVG
ncbi:hypothetical protein [Streptomyces sp. NBC_01568]|uniref:hypothetical protein n=1 Tax=Streptomyces sp. NBC_01568 TaxID=2975882 RepID=UPI002F91A96C